VITRRFFTICATGVSHLLVFVKQLLTNAILIREILPHGAFDHFILA
jgi:hypothetical protein